jgi:DNA-binding MarR family transcriptional regulator
MTPQDIGNKGELDKITVSRSATALIDRGLLLQKRNPEDGRSHFLQLTADGRSLYEEIAPAALRLEQDLLSRFSKEDRAQLQSLLRRIEEAANSP